MRVLLLSSILYLLGVVAVLLWKPTLMFTEDGTWKEFSLVSNPKYTWFPFWLFCIVWALISFAISRIAIGASEIVPPTEEVFGKRNRSGNGNRNSSSSSNSSSMKPGYYVLNREASEIEGVPRYVYIGAEEPSE